MMSTFLAAALVFADLAPLPDREYFQAAPQPPEIASEVNSEAEEALKLLEEAESTPQSSDTTVKAPQKPALTTEEWNALAQNTLKNVETLCGQKLTRPLKSDVRNKEEVTAFMKQRIQEEYEPGYIDSEELLYKRLGLIPKDMHYQEFMVSLLTEQVAGYYDHIRETLHIADWIEQDLQEPTLAHEIYHAIQTQEWGARDFLDSKKYNQDRINAHAALLEGDATILMLDYSDNIMLGGNQKMSQNPRLLRGMAKMLVSATKGDAQNFPIAATAPEALLHSMVFPYEYGLNFLATLREKGWSDQQFRDLYKNPPTTTEQILHPERFIERDEPSEVSCAVEKDVKWQNPLGEYYLRLMLLGSMSYEEASQNAQGWDGDFTWVEPTLGEGTIITASTWDSEEKAKAFTAALKKRFENGPSKLAVEQSGTEVYFSLSLDKASARAGLAKAQSCKITHH